MRAAVFLAGLLAAWPVLADDGTWLRSGLSVYWRATPSVPLIDTARVREQKQRGCSGTGVVRFGYSASLRRSAPQIEWSTENRRRFAGAALTDRRETAYSLLTEVVADPALSVDARALAENQRVITAIMFGDLPGAEQFLVAGASDDRAAAPIRADRVFVRALIAEQSAISPSDWRGVDDLLARALELDPSHFGVRAHRVLTWLLAVEGTNRLPAADGCETALQMFSTLVLDLSEAGPCPLLVGHADHVLSRGLLDASRAEDAPMSVTAQSRSGPWRVFAAGLLAEVVGNTNVREAAVSALEGATADRSPGQCRGLIASAMTDLIGSLDGDAK